MSRYLALVLCWSLAAAFVTPSSRLKQSRSQAFFDPLRAAQGEATSAIYQPVIDFAKGDAVDMIERLDDVIMGGISTSTVSNVTGQKYARWVGVCRTDGGGFCGFRTYPFEEPLYVGTTDGFYLTCRLASDQESNRRVWKMSTRVKPDRGEVLYQAPVFFEQVEDQWSTVKVPFSSFRLVRGPRMIPDAPPLNTTGGIYQIGMTMSKFEFGDTTTELKNFREGFFDLQIREIGFYKDVPISSVAATPMIGAVRPKVMSEVEMKKKLPVLMKVLRPIAKLFFSEQSQRRKSALKILREKRGFTRAGAILFGLRSRARSVGWLNSFLQTCSILAVDSARSVVFVTLRLTLLFPVKLVLSTIRLAKNLFPVKSATSNATILAKSSD